MPLIKARASDGGDTRIDRGSAISLIVSNDAD
jgi:hypothetical protein